MRSALNGFDTHPQKRRKMSPTRPSVDRRSKKKMSQITAREIWDISCDFWPSVDRNDFPYVCLFFQKLPYPKSIWFIVGNEFCERFSYYGMKGKNNNDRKPFKDRDYRKRDLKTTYIRQEMSRQIIFRKVLRFLHFLVKDAMSKFSACKDIMKFPLWGTNIFLSRVCAKSQ